jgi:hypothetical protein
MKKYIALIALIAGLANGETIQLETPINVGGTISAIEVGGVQYNAEDNSWSINASPVVDYAEPQNNNGVHSSVLIAVNLHITVQREEIETALGISNLDEATVKQLNDTVRAIALSKALAALQPE